MKFSLAATSALLLTTLATLARGDEYAKAIKDWCHDLEVVAPNEDSVVVAGGLAKVTVTRQPDERKKTITGLDLYSVSEGGDAKYIQNVWQGNFPLNKQASISDTVPANATAGLYYYRVWVTNDMNGMHGPDCLETSHTFRVTSGVHKDAAGMSYYTESLDDIQFYRPEYFKGCFGLKVTTPKKDQTVKLNKHVTIAASRDKTSQAATLKKVDLYKSVSDNEAKFIETVWTGEEDFTDEINIKDHFVLDDEHIDHDATYYYTLSISSNKAKEGDEDCTFHSEGFKIEKSD